MSIGSEDRVALQKKSLIVSALLVVCIGFSLCVDLYTGTIASPLKVLGCYGMFFSQLFAQISGGQVLTGAEIIAIEPSYYYLTARAGTTFITALAGALLSLAGSLYQSVFKNPIASPSMLGVSSGISLGHVVLVLVFGTSAATMLGVKYALSYGFAIGMLVIMFALSKFISGRGRSLNIINMLVVGTLLSQLVGVVVTYAQWYLFDDEMYLVYNNLNEVLSVNTDALSLVLFTVLAVASVVPVFLYRFRLNVLSFDESDIRMLGVDANKIQLVALVCGTVMMVASQVAVGTVSMISLVVPHVSRTIFGAEFRKQTIGNCLIGAFLLVLCRDVLACLPFVSSFLPIGTVVSIIVLPLFVWIIATQQRSWE